MGVYYNKEAFLGTWSRVAIGLIDLGVVGITSAIFAAIMSVSLPPPTAPALSVIGVLLIGAGYFVFLKRTAFRTIGYRMFQVRVVDFQGNRPSIFQMVNRALFLALGPVNGMIDLLWVSSDDSKQAIRDLWSQTYLVRDSVEPAGRGRIITRRYGIMGFNFVFQEVLKDGAHSA
jgi:uncharacterized RDD family membrane protein YckC